MVEQDGTICFVQELLETADQFLSDYERLRGPLQSDLERGLVLTYALGVMCCDLQAILNCLGESPVFGALHPRVVFERCAATEERAILVRREAAIREALIERAWLSLQGSRGPTPKT